MKSLAKDLGLAVCLLAIGQSAFSTPVRCSPGYQDATCPPALQSSAQVAPTCSMAPGWTTVVASQWQGYKYSTPQCQYVAPPTCGTGLNQDTAPTWNGSTWVGLACSTPPAQPTIPPLTTIATLCGNAVSQMMAADGYTKSNSFYGGGTWGSWTGPVSDFNSNGYNSIFAYAEPNYSGAVDTYYAPDTGSPRGSSTGDNGTAVCTFEKGTGNLVLKSYYYTSGYDGG